MLLGASIYYVARRALHAACCPSYPASCLVRAASCTCAVKYQHRPEGCRCRWIAGLWVLFGGARHANASGVGLPFPRGRRGEDSAATRLGDAEAFSHQRSFWCWGGRGLPSRSIPQPRHSGPVPHSGTVPRSVTSSHGGTASHRGSVARSDMVSLGMGPIVVATSQGRTSDVERGSPGNGRGRERAMRAQAC